MKNTALKSLQEAISKNNIDIYYMNTSDYHMSEYVPDYFKTIRYFSGFSGSLATLLVSKDDAHIFVDGRYHTQADNECLKNDVIVEKLGTSGCLDPIEFILKNYKNKVVGLDGKRTSISFVKSLLKHRIQIKSIDIYSDLIENRAPLYKGKIEELPLKYTGLSRKDKLDLIKYCLGNKCHIVNNLESIAYILNLRSKDIVCTPVFLAYLVVLNKEVYLFTDIDRFDSETLDNLYEDGIVIRPYDSYYEFLDLIKKQTILIDENKVNYETYVHINKHGNRIHHMRSLIEDMKAIKNETEQSNLRKAHIYEGVAILRFLMWLDEVDKTTITEYDALKKVNEIRLAYKAIDLSFNSIVAYNENAAMMHYSPSENNTTTLKNEGALLFDIGCHYEEGTTDTTRTVALGEVSDEFKMYFTLVLKSMFNLSELHFLKGMCGNQIDIVARKDLWAIGVDYRCGTGHGVGYRLSVHEFPPNIRYTTNETSSVELKPGMVFSDEPGVYFENKFGIRCENNLLCKVVENNEYGEFLGFETLTMVPFDLRLIDKKYLDEKTINALNDYHQKVYDNLSPYLDEKEKAYLRKLTRKI